MVLHLLFGQCFVQEYEPPIAPAAPHIRPLLTDGGKQPQGGEVVAQSVRVQAVEPEDAKLGCHRRLPLPGQALARASATRKSISRKASLNGPRALSWS